MRSVREVELYPIQHDFVADQSRYVAFIGGRNSGKTYAGSWKALTLLRPNTLGLIAAPDFPMLEFGAKRAFLERLDEWGVKYQVNQQRGVVTLPDVNAEVRMATLETESRVRGPNYAWAWVDEVEYITDRGIWSALKGAVRAGGSPQLYVTSTPKGRRIVWDEWIINSTENHAFYRATTRDNPYINASDFISGLGYTGRFLSQEIDAEFVAFQGLVYPDFVRTEHVRVVDVTGWRTVVAVDIGTRNPTAILTCHNAGDGRIHVSREVYRRNLSSAEIVSSIRDSVEGSEVETIVIDPSAAGYVLELRRLGYHVTPGHNAIMEGIGRVTTALVEGMSIDPSCSNLIGEFESYRYPDGTRTESDKPVKENDHALDALRYAVMHLSAPGLAGRLFL